MEQSRQEIIKRIFEHSEAMKRGMYTHMQAFFHKLPLSRSQVETLSAINYLQPVSSKGLAEQLYLTPGAVSQSVDALHQEGYLIRQSDPNDRRVQFLKLSKKGEKLLQDIEKRRRSMMEATMKDLTLEELAVWLKVQVKVSEQFKAAHLKAQADQAKTKKEGK